MNREGLIGLEAKDTSDLKQRVWEEQKKLWRIAFPAMVARVTQYGTLVVTQAFIGHISKVELAAYALIQIIAVRFARGILMEVDLKISMKNLEPTAGHVKRNRDHVWQAFGAKQYHMMGIYLQKSWIINLATATLLLPFFIFSTPIFKLLGEQEDIASDAGYISLWFIPVLYSLPFILTIQKYLQAQLKNSIVGWLSSVSFVLHVLLSWIFVSVLNWGIPGAMSAMIISTWLVVIGEFSYVLGGWCPNSWRGFSLSAFVDLVPALKLSISSGVMLCLELWYYAVLILLAGYMKNATIAMSAFSICLNIIAWEFMVSLGFLSASSVRVSNELGRGNVKAAKFSIKVILSTSICIGVIFWILCLVFGHKIAYLFTSDDEVAEYVSNLSVLLAFSVLLNSVQPVLSGVAIGAGRQTMVAYVNICCYYVIGVPVGVLLGYVAHLQVKICLRSIPFILLNEASSLISHGIWTGMILGVVMQSLVLGYITSRTDWDEQVNAASERLNRWLLRPSEASNGSSTR